MRRQATAMVRDRPKLRDGPRAGRRVVLLGAPVLLGERDGDGRAELLGAAGGPSWPPPDPSRPPAVEQHAGAAGRPPELRQRRRLASSGDNVSGAGQQGDIC